jgi:lipoprotein NlpD
MFLKHANGSAMYKVLILIALSSGLLGCSNTSSVPVREGSINGTAQPIATESKVTSARTYIVQPGDTLYSIAWDFSLDYRDLAAINNIPAPYILESGQTLQLMGNTAEPSQLIATEPTGVQVYAVNEPTFAATPTETQSTVSTNEPAAVTAAAAPIPVATTTQQTTPAETTPAVAPASVAAAPIQQTSKHSEKWVWPAKGKVTRGFSKQNKGMDIEGQRGDPIYATASGQVVYSGTGLRGYGQLIIIKHNAEFLSAYAHNSVVQVAEGDNVKQGQKIAEMGDTGTNKVKLHFELRQRGKPVDPQKYLPSR